MAMEVIRATNMLQPKGQSTGVAAINHHHMSMRNENLGLFKPHVPVSFPFGHARPPYILSTGDKFTEEVQKNECSATPANSLEASGANDGPDPTPPLPVSSLPCQTTSDAVSESGSTPRSCTASSMHPVQRPSSRLKRRRSLTDVDGPNTAAMCSKKRRLRRYLITSRLSQPFSLPATHILNRESAASGDKRFAKMAAIMSSRRLALVTPRAPQNFVPSLPGEGPPPLGLLVAGRAVDSGHILSVPRPDEMLRRAAMINRIFRERYPEAFTAKGGGSAVPVQRLPRTEAHVPLHCGSNSQPPPPPSQPRTTMLSSATACSNRPPYTPSRTLEGQKPATQTIALRERDIESHEEDEDDGAYAFPTTYLGSCYEASDDPEDVYADFGIIFGHATGQSSFGEDRLDDCMDELDGIAHIPP